MITPKSWRSAIATDLPGRLLREQSHSISAPPRHAGEKWIRLVRFTADCPLCGGSVELMPGKPDHRIPLVGHCLESPHDHVFSFDRSHLLGTYIGPPLPAALKSPTTSERDTQRTETRGPAIAS